MCVNYMTGTPEGSTESGFMEKLGIELATPGLQGIALIHYTTGASLFRWEASFKFMFLWPFSLAVPVLAAWVYAFCGSMSRNSRRLNQQWFWFKSVSEDGATA